MPVEGVVILGMHRGGTSLITRLVSLLGLAVCRDEDLLVGYKGNPRGHWESKSLVAFNRRLLDELGGTWFCPPLLGASELSRMLDRHGADALSRLHHAHPERPWVWKDPRTCVLLPFWSAVLERRAAYVLVVRHPFEVSDSLARRNKFTPLLGLALWERYMREAMLGAAGRPVMVCTYDGVLADPVGWCERLVAFLAEVGLASCAVDRAAVEVFAMKGLRHSQQSWTELQPGPLISPQQVALAQAASVFTTQASYVPPSLPAETPETESVLSEVRRHVGKRGGGARRIEGMPSHLVNATGPREDSELVAEQPVSVVLARSDKATEASILALAATLPRGSEILLAGDEREPVRDGRELGEISLRFIGGDSSPGGAEALARGATAARSPIVLLTTTSVLRCDPWYAAFSQALAQEGVAGVEPVMRFSSCPDQRHFGRAFSDEDLASSFVACDGAQESVAAALLSGAHSAYNRRVLVAAGGVDGEFSSVSAAVAELSLRLWRMGFRCRIVSQVEAWSEDAQDGDGGDDAERLYDRLRIAALHFGAERLQAFTERAGRLPAYDAAAERLAASDVEHRRATVAAICAFPVERYFDEFPLTLTTS